MNNYISNYLSSIPPTDSDGNIDRRRVVTITVVQVAVKTTRLYVIVVRKILVAFCGIDYSLYLIEEKDVYICKSSHEMIT